MRVEQLAADLRGPFDLSSDRTRDEHAFRMETTYIHFGMSGRRLGTESYRLSLEFKPAQPAAQAVDRYACSQLQLQTDDGPAAAIPELTDWAYTFDPTLSGADGRGPLWGIPQESFKNLSDGRGEALPFAIRYAAYVNFIDFHSINDIFTRPMKFGQGIQDLTEIGQRVVHPASFVEALVSFTAEVRPGSVFRNGEVTLELKGVTVVDGAPCAIVTYDAGESWLKMITQDPAGNESVTDGGSHYKGDISIDLATRWVRRATLDEYQVTETWPQGSSSTVSAYTVRHLLVRLIS